MKTEKRNISFSIDETNVTYTPIFYLTFQPQLSNGSENDSFMFLNIPLYVILY
jgi:hypothetical protein